MTNEDYSKVPPPHLLKKFSEQAREDSNKRGRPGYCKTFAKLCIDWALNSKSSPNNLQIRSSDIVPPPELKKQWFAAWESSENEELSFADFVIPRAAAWGAEISGAASQPGSSSEIERRSDIIVSPELIEQWRNEWIYKVPHGVDELDFLAQRGAQYGADQELEACCEWLVSEPWFKYEHDAIEELRAARRPKPPSLKELALDDLRIAFDRGCLSGIQADTIRRALEQLPDHE